MNITLKALAFASVLFSTAPVQAQVIYTSVAQPTATTYMTIGGYTYSLPNVATYQPVMQTIQPVVQSYVTPQVTQVYPTTASYTPMVPVVYGNALTAQTVAVTTPATYAVAPMVAVQQSVAVVQPTVTMVQPAVAVQAMPTAVSVQAPMTVVPARYTY